MNQEDDKIKKLFQQIREDDERNAPSFTHDWNSAMHGMDKPRRRWPAWQMAAGVAALLILAGTGLWILIRPASNEIENGELIIKNNLKLRMDN